MKRFNFKLIAIAMMVAAGWYSIDAEAAGLQPDNNPTVAKMHEQVKSVRPFRGKKPWGVSSMAGQNAPYTRANGRRAAVDDPSTTFGQLSRYNFLEAPDGTTWFYTAEYEVERIEHEYYTEKRLLGYTFTVYDSSFKEVGKIKDKITLDADFGETGAVAVELDPTVSTKFFNTDDKVEVMVFLAMNTDKFKNHYYNKVYSIGGEKDSDGNDICIATMPGRCVDVFNAASDAATENCFYTFVEDQIYPDEEGDDFVDYVNHIKTHVSVYSKAQATAGPALFLEKEIYMSCYPGDTTDGIYFISKAVSGKPYFIFSYYEKPYFVDPTGMASDESATKDNNFVIEVYDGSTLSSTTKIPVEIVEATNQINYTFYSIGSVSWKDDVDMTVNGTPQAPAFLVARDYTKASNLEAVESSYDIYGSDGKLIRNLAGNTESIFVLAPIEGQQPQAMFVNVDDNGDYVFNFIDLYSGEKVLSQHYLLDDNVDDVPDNLPAGVLYNQLTSMCQRVPTADGSYQYVFEMRYDDTDADGNDLHRMAWINKDGTLARIDKLNMGKDIMAATVNMDINCLSPTLFDTDEAMEYAVLVKRATENGTTKEEFLVIDDNGKWYAQFSEADGKGSLDTFSILPGTDKNRLQMVYTEGFNTYHVDIYDLPFEKESSITRIEAVEAGVGEAEAVYYDLSGRRVSNPKSGIYVKKMGSGVKKVVVQ